MISSSSVKKSSPVSRPTEKLQPSTRWKNVRGITKTCFIVLFPPLLTSFLLKSTVLLAGGVVLFHGISFFGADNDPVFSPVIMTLEGPVQGKLAYSRNGSAYWQYLSIPFAQPPIGTLRFKPPVPMSPWEKVHQGLIYPPACAQFEPVALIRTWGVEDCLFLNVFVPNSSIANLAKPAKSIPVIVYIHGGGFVEGQSSFYQPDFIISSSSHEVLVVTFNYRVGPLGFLNFQEENDTTDKYPRGNMGLKDQNLVLHWVQRNIAQFGGDPNRVTLMGDSAGAVSVHLHMLSPMSRNLFHRAITFSGSSLAPWGFTNTPRKIAFEYGRRLGCPTQDASSLLQCYMNLDPHEMVKLQYSWSDPLHDKDEFVPSVEKLVAKDSFLTQTPIDMLRSANSTAKVPLLTGATSGEGVLRSGRFRAMPETISMLDHEWNNYIHNVIFLDYPLTPEVAQSIRSFYFSKDNFTKDPDEFFQRMTDLTSDALFVGPVHTAALHHARAGNPTYLFYYNYRPLTMPATFTFFSQSTINDNFVAKWAKLAYGTVRDWVSEFVLRNDGAHSYGVGHAENLFHIWNYYGITKWLTLFDTDFSTNLIQSIVDFAYASKPLSYRGMSWPEINDAVESSKIIPYMKLDGSKEPAIMQQEPFKERMEFWNKLKLKFLAS